MYKKLIILPFILLCLNVFAKNNKDFQLIVFDAHPDLMDDFRPPTQEDYLRVLIEENIVNPESKSPWLAQLKGRIPANKLIHLHQGWPSGSHL